MHVSRLILKKWNHGKSIELWIYWTVFIWYANDRYNDSYEHRFVPMWPIHILWKRMNTKYNTTQSFMKHTLNLLSTVSQHILFWYHIILNINAYWVMIPCSQTTGYQGFEGPCYLHIEEEIPWRWRQFFFSRTLVTRYYSACNNILEYNGYNQHHRKLQSCPFCTLFWFRTVNQLLSAQFVDQDTPIMWTEYTRVGLGLWSPRQYNIGSWYLASENQTKKQNNLAYLSPENEYN